MNRAAHGLNISDTVTDGIRVQTKSMYVAERSDPSQRNYFFAYTIRISNEGKSPAQLLSRHWVITDGVGRIEEVRGPGVVGETPRLHPGEEFEYTSYCPLSTPSGTMHGEYRMLRDDGAEFDARIGAFKLLVKFILN